MEKNLDKRIARVQAMKIIYMAEFNDITISAANILAEKNLLNDLDDELEEGAGFLPEALDLIKFISDKIDTIDELITKALKNYTLDRLNLVDRAIVRVAVAELMQGTPKQVAINEALEITKLYSDKGDHKAVAFNNKLLDNISSSL